MVDPHVSAELLAYHRERFLRFDIPIVEDTARRPHKAERVVIVDPVGIIPRRFVTGLVDRGRQILFVDQRYEGVPYGDSSGEPGLWLINLWPKGSVLAEGEEREGTRQGEFALLAWSSAMAEDAVAAAALFDAQVVIGVGRAGGVIAAEIAERLRIGMVLYLAAVEGTLGSGAVEGSESEIMRDLAALWAEASAVRAANMVVSGQSEFDDDAMHVLHEYDVRRRCTVATDISPRWLAGALDTVVSGEHNQYADGWGDGFFAHQGRAFHRATQVWRGDLPMIEEGHKKAAAGLMPHLKRWNEEAKGRGRRLRVGFGGESGSGKTEIAGYLKLLFHLEDIHSVMIPGDAFFKRSPSANLAERSRLNHLGRDRLRAYLTSDDEIDYARLEEVLNAAKDPRSDIVFIPSDARRVEVGLDSSGRLVRRSRRYERVPVYLSEVDLVFVDLTVSPLLDALDVRVFYEHTYRDKLEKIRRRNIERDQSFDADFAALYLELEHEKIAPLKERAHVLVDRDYAVRVVSEPF